MKASTQINYKYVVDEVFKKIEKVSKRCKNHITSRMWQRVVSDSAASV